ncbi:MAG TPA: uroporphyrinogen decarboxylase family protein [Azospirillaceae bacterium]|nr:uroporphyrinogen decarboxylase family protein [Azospirillaceae bacterium]
MNAQRRAAPRYRELLMAVLSGTPAPVCPVFAHQHHPSADQDGERLAEATLAWQSRFDADLVKITPASTWQIRDYGVEDSDDPGDPLGRRRITRRVVTRPDDWRRLPRLDPHSGFTARILRAAVLVKRGSPAAPVLATVYSPASQAAKLAGDGLFAEHVRRRREDVAAGLRTIADNTTRLIAALADIGVDGVFLAAQNARSELFPARLYAEALLSGDLACLDAASGLSCNILHLHGDGVHHELFQDVGSLLLHLEASSGNASIEALLRSGAKVASGPSPGGAISAGNRDAALTEVHAMLRRFKGPRFVLAPGCTLPLSTPAANIDALFDAARAERPDRRPPPAG